MAVLASTAAAVLLELMDAELLATGVLEELDELLQPAASKMDPTAAADATIALDARKINPPMPPP